MTFTLGDRTLEFLPVTIEFSHCRSIDLFGKKNNRTLAETLRHAKYARLAPRVIESYADCLGLSLGDFLLKLKQRGDPFYHRFLNRYGDGCYCEFRLRDSDIRTLKGLYCFTVEGALKYIGKSTDNFARRIDHGYGRIHPKNCFRDGQATNCHLNALIASNLEHVALLVCPMADNHEISVTEAALIAKEKPAWNIQLNV